MFVLHRCSIILLPSQVADLVSLWLEIQMHRVEIPAGSDRLLVIMVVHMKFSKLFKGLECTVLSMVLCTIKNP